MAGIAGTSCIQISRAVPFRYGNETTSRRNSQSHVPYFIEHTGKPFQIQLHLNGCHFAHAGCVMPNSDDSEELRAELLRLLDKQFEILELSTCVTLTDEEQREYEVRKQRIHELFKQLGTFGAAA